MTTLRPSEARVQLRVRLGAGQIPLRSAARERSGDDEPLVRRDADGGLAFVADEDLELAHERRTNDCLLRVRDLLFAMLEVRASAHERGPADAAVLAALVFVVWPNRDRDVVAHLPRDAACNQRLSVRLRRGLLYDPVQARRVHERLLILDLVVTRQHERRLAARRERAAERAFDDVFAIVGLGE